MLHTSRPVRWDSDHVVTMNDQTLDLFKEVVRAGALDRTHIGLDYFDASINRIGAYIIGTRLDPEVYASGPSLSRLRPSASTRTTASTSSVSPFWKRPSHFRSEPFTTTSTSRTVFL